jgi:hypothetical protein
VKIKIKKMYDYFYPILLGVILIQIFFMPEIRLGVVTAIIIIFLAFSGISKKTILFNSIENKLVLLYFVYNTATFVLYVINGVPLSVFIAEWSNSILPIVFYYFAQENRQKDDTFYEKTLYTLILSFAIGYYLWISESGMYRIFMNTTEGPGTDLLFFQSVFGLTATGAFGIIGFIISARIIFKSKGANGKIALIISSIAAILTFRRAALLVLLMYIAAFHYLGYYKYRFIKRIYFFVELIILYIILMLVYAQYGELIDGVFHRLGMISDAFESRSDDWKKAFDYPYLITGRGLGSVGHKALEFTEILIPDGNYFKIIAETGIIGFSLFVAILVLAIVNGIKNLREDYMQLGIVLAMCLIAVGSNIFTYQSIAPIFWFSIGKLLLKKSKLTY